MMKRLASLYFFALSVLLMLTACQSDETTEQGGEQHKDGLLQLRIATNASNAITRAKTVQWTDTNAEDEEMMNTWVVVIADADDNALYAFACNPTNTNKQREIDEVGHIPPGAYKAYSFANMSVTKVAELLGITITMPTMSNNDVVYQATAVSGTVDADKSVRVDGNNFNKFIYSSDENNGFDSYGIPMSNVQTISASDDTKDLIVIRMLSKFEVQVYNEGTSDVVVKSISLTDVTDNVANNLKLLPNLTSGANTMEFVHKDIQPNLGTGAKRGNLIFIPAGDDAQRTVAAGNTSPVKFTFYVNESVAPDNGSGLFYLSFGFKGETEYHHALINQSGMTSYDDNAWHYIARNDYRIIPIHLTDWLFRIEPLAFAPIAGYPAKTLSSDALAATFSTGGPIILQPFVKKNNDRDWRDFFDPEVTFVSLSWKNSDGTDISGDGKILETPLEYDPINRRIIGVLNNNLPSGTYKTAVTVSVKLGPSGNQYSYSYTFDLILQK